MFSSARPPCLQSQIPTVKQICEQLGFGDPYERPDWLLKNSTQSWRRQYKTREGILGHNLTEWRQPKTQIDLQSMTKDYLENGGYGLQYWSADSPGPLAYPKDRQRITELLMQLFWKENTNQAYNAKHPDRGRRPRESVESDQSSTTVASPTLPTYNSERFPSAQVSYHSALSPTYLGIGIGPVPKGSFSNALHRSNLSHHGNGRAEPRRAVSPAQSSGSLFVPSTADSEERSTVPQYSPPTLLGSSTQSPSPDIPDDVYDFCDEGPKRQAKDKACKRITSNYRDPWNTNQDDGIAAHVAPPAKMVPSPAASQTPKKSRPEQTTPHSKPAGVHAFHGRSSADSRGRKRRDVDGDDEDAEYDPRPRSKRQKATSNASDDAPSDFGPQLPEPAIEASCTRRSEPSAQDECWVCQDDLSRITDGSTEAREAHVATCVQLKLSTVPSASIPGVQIPGNVLPNRPRSKQPVPAAVTAPNINEERSIPESPPADMDHGDGVDEALEALRGSLANPPNRTPQPSPGQGADDPERSLPSPASNTGPSEIAIPRPLPYHRLQSPTKVINSKRQQTEQTRPVRSRAVLRPEIRYYIIASRSGRSSKIHWPEGSLADKAVDTLFDEVLDRASKDDVQRIAFKLTTSVSDIQYTITRNDEKIYEIMKKTFKKDINVDLGRGNTDFDIELELDPGKSGVPVGTEESGVEFEFSL